MSRLRTCRLPKWYYRAQVGQREYLETLSCAREGINLPEAGLKEFDCLISPLVKRGQSLAHIHAAHKEDIPVTERTLYNYCLMYEYPTLSVVEMDTVEGRKGGKVLLTLLVRSYRLQLAFLMDAQTQACVKTCFDMLRETLGEELFSLIFALILTDNGSEFLDPLSLETALDGTRRIRVFYCDPNCSYQKGMLEKNHEFIRYVLPKGTPFDSLTQENVALIVNHVNAAHRDSLSGKPPYDTAEFLLSKRFLVALKLNQVLPDEVLLKPQLLH
jgi:hypothetical protein